MSRVTPCEGPGLRQHGSPRCATASEYSRGWTRAARLASRPLEPGRMIRIACVAAALLMTLSTPAKAQLRAVSDGPTPVLFGDNVLWGERSGETVQFVSAPLAGGPAVPFGTLAVPRRDAMWLAAAPGLLAVQLRDSRSPRTPARLYVAGQAGTFGQ